MLLENLLTEIPKSQFDSSFSGGLINNDFVLAISTKPTGQGTLTTNVGKYAVVQDHIEGVDSSFNPTVAEKVYIRAGASTIKTGTQRQFKITGDRAIGDEFQDYVFSNKIKYGTGADVVVDYIYFNLQNGKGEMGKAAIIVNSDGSGNAEDSATVDIELRKTGATPKEINILDLFPDYPGPELPAEGQ